MVVKIQPSTASVCRAVDYNEQKVSEGVASVAFSSKIDDVKNAMATFQLYENAAIRATKLGFHASVNPSPQDLQKMSKEDIIEFIKDWMRRMGYGNQPYIIYEHNDNARKHYHVLSVRVDENGHKIDEWQERKRCAAIIKELEPKYGYSVGRSKSDKDSIHLDTKETAKGQKDTRPVPRFKPSIGYAAEQIRLLVSIAGKYHFTTQQQYVALLRDMGVKVEFVEPKLGKPKTYYYGIDPKRNCVCTVKMEGKKIGAPSRDELEAYMSQCKAENRRKEKERVGRLASFCLKHSTSKLHYDRMLRKQNIVVKYSFDANDKLMGATYIDHQTRCVFKASELKKHLKLEDIDTKITKEWPKFDHSDKVGDNPQEVSKIDKKVEKLAGALADISMDALDNSPKKGKDKKRTKEAQVHKRTYHG